MNLLKRVMALCVSSVMIFSTAASIRVNADETPADGGYSEYADKIGVLNALGITDIKEKGFSEDVSVSREDFAKGVASMLTDDISAAGLEATGDLSESDTGMLYLNSLGIINGMGNGVFEPSGDITVEQAAKMSLTALGFEDLSYYKGGYSTGFMTEGARIGLLDGIKKSAGETLTNGDRIKLLYNLLDIDILVQKSFGSSNTYERAENETLLAAYRNILHGKGIVEADKFSGMYSEADGTGDDSVVIENVRYENGETDTSDLLGINTEFWYREERGSSDKTLVYIAERGNTRRLVLKSADIIGFNGGKYTYETESGKTSEISIADNAVILYNGAFADSLDADKYVPEYGSVEFAANGNGAYTLVKITDIMLTVAETVSADGLVIYDKYAQDFNIDMTDAEYALYDESGKQTGISSVVKGNIIETVKTLYAGGTFFKLTVSPQSVSGKIDRIRTKSSGKFDGMVIDGEEYGVSERFNYLVSGKKITAPQVGESYTFALNLSGEIVNIERTSDKGYRLGYFKRFSAESNSLEPKKSVRIFDQSGAWETYELAKKVKLNGVSVKTENLKSMDFYIDKVCKYELNIAGEVTSMSFPSETDDDFKEIYNKSSAYYRKYSAGGVFGEQNGKTAACCAIADDAIVFAVSDVDATSVSELAEEYRYSVLNVSSLRAYVSYNNVKIFNTQGEIGIGDVALIKVKNYGYVSVETERLMVVDGCRSVVSDGEVKQAVYGLCNGQEKEIVIDDQRSTDEELPFKSGDVIFCSTFSDGVLRLFDNVKYYDKMLDYDAENPVFSGGFDWNAGNAFGVSYASSMSSDMRARFGTAYKADGEYVWLNISDDPADTTAVEAAKCGNARIYVYDDRNSVFKVGKPADIIGYESDPKDYSKLLIFYNNGYTEMVVYP